MNLSNDCLPQKIPAKYKFLLGSKWTSIEPFMGWKHFQVIEANYETKTAKALIQSICNSSVNVWIEADSLKDKSKWQAGWKRIMSSKKAEM